MSDRGTSSLTRYAPLMREAQPGDARQAARQAYIDSQGEIVLINRQWLNGWAQRKQLEILAESALGVKGLGK